MPRDRAYSAEEIEAAMRILSEPGRLDGAQRSVAHVAPELQRLLLQALDEGGWFGSAHTEAVLRAAGTADPDERMAAVGTLVAEESRLAMLVGVAIGMELARTLDELDEEEG